MFLMRSLLFLNSRNLHDKAVDVGNRLLQSPGLDLIEIDRTLFDQAWLYFQSHQDKSYSLTDCLSFVVMQQQQIITALILDNHFRQAGFQVLP